mmetsp:Transcript_5033/g.15080  ORF Transcript_5033/g.15080 Transcript_5033/m.15080 type:complete len:207 (-) Transcript_5033:6325-6945(-)
MLPRDNFPHNALCLHSLCLVVHVRKADGHRPVRMEQGLLPGLDGTIVAMLRSGVHGSVAFLPLQGLDHRIEPVNRFDELAVSVLDFHHSFWLEHPTPCGSVCVHLNPLRVDLGVDDSPGTATQLALGWKVDVDGTLVNAEGLHNPGSVLEHAIKQIPHASGEASPVGQNKQGQPLEVKLLDCLSCLQSRVREPNLPSLRNTLLRTR